MRAILVLALVCGALRATTLPLHTLDLSTVSTGWGTSQKNLSITGKPLRIGGREFATGIGSHAPSEFLLQLDGRATFLTAQVGIDDNAPNPEHASVEFRIFGDGRELWKSGVCRRGDAPKPCRVELAGVRNLEPVTTVLTATIPRHGVHLVRLTKKSEQAKP